MCGADHAHIGVNRSRTAEALELSFLHNAKKLWLQFQGKVADLVQKQGTSVSPLKPSNTARDRPGVGATLVTEQLAFKQTCRNCGTIHLHKRTVRSVAVLVNGFRNQFLASSCFPVDQHRGVGRGHDPYHVEYAPQSIAVTDNAGKSAAVKSAAVERDFRRRRIPDFQGCGMVDRGQFNRPTCVCSHFLPPSVSSIVDLVPL